MTDVRCEIGLHWNFADLGFEAEEEARWAVALQLHEVAERVLRANHLPVACDLEDDLGGGIIGYVRVSIRAPRPATGGTANGR